MKEVVKIGKHQREIELECNAATPLVYKRVFGRNLFDEFTKRGIYTPFAWMGNFPNSLDGDYHAGLNERIAKVMNDRAVAQLAEAFKFLKEETVSESYYESWAEKNPLI